MTYEIFCDGSNQIIIDQRIPLKITYDAGSPEAKKGYVFDSKNLIKTSLVGCPVISFEISPLSAQFQMMSSDNCTSTPCKDIKNLVPDIISYPDSFDFKIKITVEGGATTIVDQSIT